MPPTPPPMVGDASAVAGSRGDAGATPPEDCAPAMLEAFRIGSALHVSAPVYDDPPPVGGDHEPCWADYGVYEDALAPGRWVHNLEHGAVVLLYDCGEDPGESCAQAVSELGAFVAEHSRTILTAYPGMPTRFAVVAWGHRLTMDCLDMGLVRGFYDEHFNQAPENVASGAPAGC